MAGPAVCLAVLAALSTAGTDLSAQALTTGSQEGQGQGTDQGTESTTPPRRPYRGIFQGANDRDRPPTLTFNGDLYAAYDDNVLANNSGRPRPTPPGVQTSGYFAGAQGGLVYSHSGRRSSWTMQGAGGLREYPDLNRLDHTINEGVTWSSQVGRYSQLAVTQSFMYTPNYRFSLFPGVTGEQNPDAGADTSTDFDLIHRPALRNSVGASFTKTLGQRGALNGEAGVRLVNFTAGDAGSYQAFIAGGSYQYRLSQALSMHLGYRYRQGEAGAGAAARGVHDIDAGVDFSKALSFSRRTRLSFSTGSGLLMGTRTAAGVDLRTRLHVTGSAQLTHEFGRTWTAHGSYRRGFQFHEGFAEPFLTDGVSLGVNGLLARRLDFTGTAGYVHASQRVSREAGDNVSATAQLRYGLTQRLAVYARYNYYLYDVPDATAVEDFLAPSGRRVGVRVGLNAYVPLKR